jgi:hypothetical protein
VGAIVNHHVAAARIVVGVYVAAALRTARAAIQLVRAGYRRDLGGSAPLTRRTWTRTTNTGIGTSVPWQRGENAPARHRRVERGAWQTWHEKLGRLVERANAIDVLIRQIDGWQYSQVADSQRSRDG